MGPGAQEAAGLDQGVYWALLAVPSLSLQTWELKDSPQNNPAFQEGRGSQRRVRQVKRGWLPVTEPAPPSGVGGRLYGRNRPLACGMLTLQLQRRKGRKMSQLKNRYPLNRVVPT